MNFDLMLTSSSYVFQGHAETFPLRRLYQVHAGPIADNDVIATRVVRQCDNRGDEIRAVLPRDDDRALAFHVGDQRVGRA